MEKVNGLKLNIKGVDYRVKLVDLIDNDSKILGQTNHLDKTILIRECEKDNVDIIAHELIHAYFYECALSCYNDDETLVSWLGFHFGDLAENVLSVLKYFKNLKGGKKCQ